MSLTAIMVATACCAALVMVGYVLGCISVLREWEKSQRYDADEGGAP